MKTTKFFGLTPLLILTLSSLSKAALITSFSLSNSNKPADWDDHLNTPSNFVTGPGSSITALSSIPPSYSNLPTTITYTQYVGFTISAEPGYEMSLTDFTFRTGGSVGPFYAPSYYPTTAYAWGYRVDNGQGYGDWVIGKIYTRADDDFDDGLTIKTWDFNDFTTKGTVEFALFGAADPYVNNGVRNPALDGFVFVRNFNVNGIVNLVPEPSAALLGALSGLALLRRRRM